MTRIDTKEADLIAATGELLEETGRLRAAIREHFATSKRVLPPVQFARRAIAVKRECKRAGLSVDAEGYSKLRAILAHKKDALAAQLATLATPVVVRDLLNRLPPASRG